MAHIEGEILIKRPVEEVFDFVADERHEPRFNPHMLTAEKVSDGLIGKGTRTSAPPWSRFPTLRSLNRRTSGRYVRASSSRPAAVTANNARKRPFTATCGR